MRISVIDATTAEVRESADGELGPWQRSTKILTKPPSDDDLQVLVRQSDLLAAQHALHEPMVHQRYHGATFIDGPQDWIARLLFKSLKAKALAYMRETRPNNDIDPSILWAAPDHDDAAHLDLLAKSQDTDFGKHFVVAATGPHASKLRRLAKTLRDIEWVHAAEPGIHEVEAFIDRCIEQCVVENAFTTEARDQLIARRNFLLMRPDAAPTIFVQTVKAAELAGTSNVESHHVESAIVQYLLGLAARHLTDGKAATRVAQTLATTFSNQNAPIGTTELWQSMQDDDGPIKITQRTFQDALGSLQRWGLVSVEGRGPKRFVTLDPLMLEAYLRYWPEIREAQ